VDEPEREGYEYLGTVGVDSGQLIVGDPSFLLRTEQSGDRSWQPSHEEIMEATREVKAAAIQTSKRGTSIAVVFDSGYGDGQYNVFGKLNEDGRIVEVVIDMQMTDFQRAVREKYRKQSTE
jgi:hypothetical protein